MAHPLPGSERTDSFESICQSSEKLWAWWGCSFGNPTGEMLTQAGQGPQEVEEGKARGMSPYGFFLADSKALNSRLQGSQAGSKAGMQAGARLT